VKRTQRTDGLTGANKLFSESGGLNECRDPKRQAVCIDPGPTACRAKAGPSASTLPVGSALPIRSGSGHPVRVRPAPRQHRRIPAWASPWARVLGPRAGSACWRRRQIRRQVTFAPMATESSPRILRVPDGPLTVLSARKGEGRASGCPPGQEICLLRKTLIT
jgi:hypothetical protein